MIGEAGRQKEKMSGFWIWGSKKEVNLGGGNEKGDFWYLWRDPRKKPWISAVV